MTNQLENAQSASSTRAASAKVLDQNNDRINMNTVHPQSSFVFNGTSILNCETNETVFILPD